MRKSHLALLAELALFASFAIPMLTGCNGLWSDDDDSEDYRYDPSESYSPPPSQTTDPAPSCPPALYVSMQAPATGDCRLTITPADSSYGYDQKATISYFFPAPAAGGSSTCTPIGSAPSLQNCHRDSLGVSITTSGTYDLAAVRQVLGSSIDTLGVTAILDCAASADSVTENQALVCAADPGPSQDDDAGTASNPDAGTTNADAATQSDASAAQDGGTPTEAGCGP